ncbi:hypothetical protein HH308_19555 [Gordonia sp. TBRC 11910]|uniref:Glycoprotein n=1 Tax=Gordonia asplenii TaxID=2725283 RepID=A0A848L2W8_9ACTN|nr:DUF6049 family protein [Gordonia asplenii]NMO03415.1 hypothetical protein [Gordonia asplenii]
MTDRTRARVRRITSTTFSLIAVIVLAVAGPLLAGLNSQLAATASAAPSGETTARFAKVSIESVTPSMVTTTSRPVVTIAGEVTNTSDRDLTQLSIRMQRGQRVADAAGLRTSLAADAATFERSGPFVNVADRLAPGKSTAFTLSMQLSGATGLGIESTGVYPLLVNLNAVPAYGVMARVADSRTLLPVLSLPPNAQRAPADSDVGQDSTTGDVGTDGSVAADMSAPASLTMLWPLAAPPQMAPGRVGGSQPRLISEDLAHSLAAGGRLRTLLDSVSTAAGLPDQTPDTSDGPGSSAPPSSTTPSVAPTPSKLQQAICLAVDPDLLVTVRAMTGGYVVTSNPADLDAPTTPGTGSDDAADWLHDLTQVASRLCVVALPFAGADLDSLHQVGNGALSESALTSPADIVDSILGVRSIRGLVVPSIGAITTDGATVLAANKLSNAVTSASSLAGGGSSAGQYRVGNLRLQSYDAPISAALGGIGTHPLTPVLTPHDQKVDLADESAVSRRQSALAAIAYPSIAVPVSKPADPTSGQAASPADAEPTVGRSALLMPPNFWSPSTADADALLSSATLLLEAGVANPTPLTKVVQQLEGEVPQNARLVEPSGTMLAANRGWLPSAGTSSDISADATLSWQLQASFVSSTDVNSSPETYLAPIRADLLRGLGSPSQDTSMDRISLRADRTLRVAAVGEALSRMRSSVTLLDPGGRYTLVSERSPLLLVARNDLDLPIRVRLDTIAPAELNIDDVGVIEIPARGTRQVQLPTRAQTSESMSVQIALVTSTGVGVGTPISLSVNSNAYGKPLFIVTLVAGVALVLLVVRRLWHRFRGQPDKADADRPEADEATKALAATDYEHRLAQEAERDALENGHQEGGHE